MFPKLTSIVISLASTCIASQCASIPIRSCSADAISLPDIPGITVYAVTTEKLTNYSTIATIANPRRDYNTTISFCNVSISYGHWGWDDNVTVTVWLPLNWTGRLSGIGGSGFASISTFERLAPTVDRGWVAVATDAGHGHDSYNADPWALSGGKINYFRLENFFASSQDEAAKIGKQVAHGLYGVPPIKSYWDGCSTGGRQGLMLAQRYPDAYDGILVGAPAINWATFVPGMFYPQFVMNQKKHYPPSCVWEFLNNATIAACDSIDGVTDGILSLPSQCEFDPHTLVGQSFACGSNGKRTITREDADMLVRFWEGPKYPDGSSIWYGMNKGTSPLDLANTSCSGLSCSGYPFEIASDWIKLFVLQNASYDLSILSKEGFTAVMNLSTSAHKALTSTDNPDLRDYRNAGGKILHWHGLLDQQIYSSGSENYYRRAEERDASLREFYRFFEAPGLNHCGAGAPSGVGLFPDDPLAALVRWVEEGIAPDVLPASSPDGQKRNLCPWPKVPAYIGGEHFSASSFECADSY